MRNEAVLILPPGATQTKPLTLEAVGLTNAFESRILLSLEDDSTFAT